MTIKQSTRIDGHHVTLNRAYYAGVGSNEYDYWVEVDGEKIGPTYPYHRDAEDLFKKVRKNIQETGRPRTRSFDETAGPTPTRTGYNDFRPLEDDL